MFIVFFTFQTVSNTEIYKKMEELAWENVCHGDSLNEDQKENKKLQVTYCTSTLLPQLTPNRPCLGWNDLLLTQGQSHISRIKIAKYAYLNWITFGSLIIWIYCLFKRDSSTGENFKMHNT